MEGRKRRRSGAVTRGGGDASVLDSSHMAPDTEFPGRRAGPASMEEFGLLERERWPLDDAAWGLWNASGGNF